MGGDETPTGRDTPGYQTVWRAPELGAEQDAICPRCQVVIGPVGQREERDLFCTQCQTLYRVTGRVGAPPTVERLRQVVVVEGEGTMGRVLRGEHPQQRPVWTGTPFQLLLWALLLALLLLVLWL